MMHHLELRRAHTHAMHENLNHLNPGGFGVLDGHNHVVVFRLYRHGVR